MERDGKTEKLEFDSVVFAAGFRASHDLYESIKKAGFECVQVGDNIKPGKVINAIHEGYHYMRVL